MCTIAYIFIEGHGYAPTGWAACTPAFSYAFFYLYESRAKQTQTLFM